MTVMALGYSVPLVSPGLMSSAAAAPTEILTCGSTVSHSIELANDVGPCPGNGLTIGANNVRLDLNGHKVFGTLNSFGSGAATDSVGIHFDNVRSSAVSNGEVFDFAAGVRVDGGSANTVTDIEAHDNISPLGGTNNGDGISIWNSSYNTVRHNVVTHNGQYSGITLVTGPYMVTNGVVDPAMSGTGNEILENQVANNNVSICGAPQCTPAATGVTVPRGSQIPGSFDQGIRVEGPNMTYTDVERNIVTDTGNNGIMVDASCHDAFLVPVAQVRCAGDVGNIHTLIKDNTSNHNGYGRTQGFGINLFGMGLSKAVQATLDTVVGNTTEYNVNSGIILYSTRAGPRGPGGLFSTPGSCNDYPPNDPRMCAAHDDTVLNNTSSFNGLDLAASLGGNNGQGDGIEMSPGADRNTVNHNTVDRNGYDGIGLEMAQLYDANNKPVFDSSGNPVYVPGTGASNNTLFANKGSGNQYFDVEDQNPGCDNNDWDLTMVVTVNQTCVRDSDQTADQPGNAGGHTGSGNHRH
jgi:hypothetical protein